MKKTIQKAFLFSPLREHNRFKLLPKAIFSGLLMALAVTNAFAHALWVEKDKDGSAAVFFGEYGEGLREKSGGRLDEISHLEVWSIGPDGHKTPLKFGKTDDRFVLETKDAGVIGVIAKDASLPVKDMRKYKIGIAKSCLYARFSNGASMDLKPELQLDVLPLTDTPDKVQVFFDGKPLGGEKVNLIAPNGWMKELKTDEEGRLALIRPWPGLYVVEVTHTVEKPGNYLGEDYEVERHRATLSFEKE